MRAQDESSVDSVVEGEVVEKKYEDEPDCSCFSCIPRRWADRMPQCCTTATQKMSLTILTVSACILGFAIGAALQTIEVSDLAIQLIRYPGEMFIRALKLIVLPLIFATIIVVPASIGDGPGASTLGKRAIMYYICTSIIGACEGLIWVNVFKPGVGINLDWRKTYDIPVPRSIVVTPAGFGYINNTNTVMTWADASAVCASEGGFLPSVRGVENIAFITGEVAGSDTVWLGLKSETDSKSGDTVCDWTDGSTNNFTNTCPEDRCLRTDADSNKKFTKCDDTLNFACQIDCTKYDECDGMFAPYCGGVRVDADGDGKLDTNSKTGESVYKGTTFTNECLFRQNACRATDEEWATWYSGICEENLGVNAPSTSKETVDAFLDIGRSAIDSNIIQSMYNLNILGLVTFAMIFGIYLRGHKHKETVLGLANTTKDVCMKIIGLIIMATPIGMLSLIIAEIARMDDIVALLKGLGIYIGTTVFAQALHVILVYPAIFFLTTRTNPYAYMLKIRDAPVTAFATSSSAATMPVTLRVNKAAGCSDETADFVIPLGATINMDGTAIGYPLSVIFLAQLVGIDLSPGDQIVIAILATVISVGAAPVPSAGMVYLILIMEAVDIPIEGAIAFLFTIDWFIDRLETATNVFGDSLGCRAIDIMQEKYMKKYDPEYGASPRAVIPGVEMQQEDKDTAGNGETELAGDRDI